MTTTPTADAIGELMEMAQTATSLADVKKATLQSVSRWIPCESAWWGSPRPHSSWFVTQDDPTYCALERMSAAPDRYAAPERHELLRSAGGVMSDVDIFSTAERGRLPLYTEILRPVGIRTHVVCGIAFRGKPLSYLILARQERGAGFEARDRTLLQSLRDALGIVEAAWAATSPSPAVNVARGILSPREAQVATLVARGLHNKEIAAVLGTSPETVRKQTSRIYTKMGARGRVQLAALLGGCSGKGRDDGCV